MSLLLVISDNFLSTIRKNNVLAICIGTKNQSYIRYFQNVLVTKYLGTV